MEKNDIMPCCKHCPSGDFDLQYIAQSRFMAICHAKECVLAPKFPDDKIRESYYISRANLATVTFEPLDNCPHIEKLRSEELLPWATTIADFTK
jgi:hypothetical protein